MTRVKGGNVAKNRRKKVLKSAKGYFGSKHRLFKTAQEQVFHSGVYAYRDRRQNKRNFRKLWITRINAGCRANDISYSKFINGLNIAGVTVNRKMLSELAIDDAKSFTSLVEIAKDALKSGKKPVVKETIKKEVVKEIPKVEKKEIKEVKRDSLEAYAKTKKGAKWTSVKDYPKAHNPLWNIPAFAAFPSATQNELNAKDAENLIKNGCKCVSEGANMPSTIEAVHKFIDAKICYGPGKAANAGGVATSGLEMSQNASMTSWSFEEVDKKLHNIMKHIYASASEAAKEFKDPTNLVLGANIAGFRKVANAMIEQGLV